MKEMKRGAEFDAAMAELIAKVTAENTPEKRDAERFAVMRRKRHYARSCAQADAQIISHKIGRDVGVIWDGKISPPNPDTALDVSQPASPTLYGGV